MAGPKLYTFEAVVPLREALMSVSAKHAAFKLKIRAFCSLTSSLHGGAAL